MRCHSTSNLITWTQVNGMSKAVVIKAQLLRSDDRKTTSKSYEICKILQKERLRTECDGFLYSRKSWYLSWRKLSWICTHLVLSDFCLLLSLLDQHKTLQDVKQVVILSTDVSLIFHLQTYQLFTWFCNKITLKSGDDPWFTPSPSLVTKFKRYEQVTERETRDKPGWRKTGIKRGR